MLDNPLYHIENVILKILTRVGLPQHSQNHNPYEVFLWAIYLPLVTTEYVKYDNKAVAWQLPLINAKLPDHKWTLVTSSASTEVTMILQQIHMQEYIILEMLIYIDIWFIMDYISVYISNHCLHSGSYTHIYVHTSYHTIWMNNIFIYFHELPKKHL